MSSCFSVMGTGKDGRENRALTLRCFLSRGSLPTSIHVAQSKQVSGAPRHAGDGDVRFSCGDAQKDNWVSVNPSHIPPTLLPQIWVLLT